MKKITSILLAGSILVTGANSSLRSQEVNRALIFNEKGAGYNNSDSQKKAATIYLNELNMNVVRDFNNKFKKAVDVRWTRSSDHTSVYFTQNGINMRSTYDRKGNWEYTLRYYDETKLSDNIRRIVKSKYYDMTISLVTELEKPANTIYFVKMEDKLSYLTVLISDGEMIEFEKLQKL